MIITPRSIEGVFEVKSSPLYQDERGSLLRLFDATLFEQQGIRVAWVQQSVSRTRERNVLRGMHLQRPPFSEAKLVTIISGRMFWAVVDLRRQSATFGQWEAFTLSPEGVNGFFAARGFAHGCLSLTSDVTLVISADNAYSSEYGTGIRWNDAELGIEWPLQAGDPVMSAEHRAFPGFSAFKTRYGGI